MTGYSKQYVDAPWAVKMTKDARQLVAEAAPDLNAIAFSTVRMVSWNLCKIVDRSRVLFFGLVLLSMAMVVALLQPRCSLCVPHPLLLSLCLLLLFHAGVLQL